jgi:hypothetical protein
MKCRTGASCRVPVRSDCTVRNVSAYNYIVRKSKQSLGATNIRRVNTVACARNR